MRDRLIPWYFVMAFMVVFIVNGIFIYYATGTHKGVVTENPYEKGLAFDEIVNEVRKQKNEAARSDGTNNQ
ncbi:MAG: FixH family protein [Rickettsiales bacterium]|nr:FixH family protein [Rickettsiales bacterium]